MTEPKHPQRTPRVYQKHGLSTLKRQIRARTRRKRSVMDGRLWQCRVLAEWHAAMTADLGGAEALSTAQHALLDIAVRTRLMLESADSFILSQPGVVNRRSRTLLPIVRERLQLADSLQRTLTLLGLERKARQVPTLAQYLTTREEPAPGATMKAAKAPGALKSSETLLGGQAPKANADPAGEGETERGSDSGRAGLPAGPGPVETFETLVVAEVLPGATAVPAASEPGSNPCEVEP